MRAWNGHETQETAVLISAELIVGSVLAMGAGQATCAWQLANGGEPARATEFMCTRDGQCHTRALVNVADDGALTVCESQGGGLSEPSLVMAVAWGRGLHTTVSCACSDTLPTQLAWFLGCILSCMVAKRGS